MATYSEALEAAVKSAVCEVFSQRQFYAGATLGLTGPGAEIGILSSPLNRAVCNEEPPPPGSPPFTGGQCPGTLYNVNVTGTIVDPPTNSTFEANLVGPLRYLTPAPPPGGGGCPNGLSFNSFEIRGSTETAIIAWSGCGATLTVNSVTALSGPDDCGDPPEDIPEYPPGGVTINTNISYTDNSSTEVSFPVSIVVGAPLINVDGRLTVPVDINLPDFNFNGELQLTPTVNFNFGTGGRPNPTPPPGVTIELPDFDEEIDGPEEPPDDNPLPIVGVVVVSRPAERIPQTPIDQENAPILYVPRVATVKFWIATYAGAYWTPDIDVRSSSSYVHCPVPWGAIDVSVTPAPGWASNSAPIFGKPLQDGLLP